MLGRLVAAAVGRHRPEHARVSTTIGTRRVLVLDGERLLALNYNLIPFSDPVWRDRECDWENEIECGDDLEPWTRY